MFSHVSRPPKRRRQQAPARGLAVVYAHDRPKRNETQRIRPLLVGRMRVYTAPKAPAADTVGPTALAAGPAGSPRRQRHWVAALPPLLPLPHKGR